MNPNQYFMSNMAVRPLMLRSGYGSMGALGKLSNGFRSLNWGKLLSGANKTLNFMNQSIPLIKQAKPMIGNVKSMLHLAKAFRNETSNTKSIKRPQNYAATNNNIKMQLKRDKLTRNSSNDMPTFFI